MDDGVQEGGVGAGLDGHPFGFGKCAFGHARVDEDEAGAALACFGRLGEGAGGAVERASDEKEVVDVRVVGGDRGDACGVGAEDHAARERRGRVAGRGMIDDVGRAERVRKPFLGTREGVAREHDGAFAVALDDRLELRSDFRESLIPGDLLEFTRAALALALQGLPDAHRMVPRPERLGAAAAVAALGMVGIGHDAHGRARGGLAFAAHGEQPASGAAHAACNGMGRPAVGLHGVDFGLDGGPGKARGRCACCRRADERAA